MFRRWLQRLTSRLSEPSPLDHNRTSSPGRSSAREWDWRCSPPPCAHFCPAALLSCLPFSLSLSLAEQRLTRHLMSSSSPSLSLSPSFFLVGWTGTDGGQNKTAEVVIMLIVIMITIVIMIMITIMIMEMHSMNIMMVMATR